MTSQTPVTDRILGQVQRTHGCDLDMLNRKQYVTSVYFVQLRIAIQQSWPSSETLYRSSNFDSQVGRKWRELRVATPSRLQSISGLPRRSAYYRPAEVWKRIRLRREGGEGMITESFCLPPHQPAPASGGGAFGNHGPSEMRSKRRMRRRSSSLAAAASWPRCCSSDF